MMTLRTLLWRELRERRVLFAVFALGLAAVDAAVTLVWLEPGDELISARYVLPALIGLLGAVLGADLGARDRERGYEAWLFRLPLSSGTFWFTKAAVVLTLFTLLAAGLVGFDCLGRLALGWPVAELIEELQRYPATAFGVCLIPIVSWAFGTLMGRTLPAAVAAPIFTFGFPLVALQLAHSHPGWSQTLFTLSFVTLPVWSASLIAGLLLGTACACRSQVGGRGRGLGAFALGATILWGPTAAVAYERSRPGTEPEEFRVGMMDDSGRFLVVTASQRRRTWRGGQHLQAAWTLDLEDEDGELVFAGAGANLPVDLQRYYAPTRWWETIRTSDQPNARTIRWQGQELTKPLAEGQLRPVPTVPGLVLESDRNSGMHRTRSMDGSVVAEWPSRAKVELPLHAYHAPWVASTAQHTVEYRDVRTGELLSASREDLIGMSSHDMHFLWTHEKPIFAVSVRFGYDQKEQRSFTTQFTFHGPEAPAPIVLEGRQRMAWIDSERIVTWDDVRQDALILRSLNGTPIRTLWKRP